MVKTKTTPMVQTPESKRKSDRIRAQLKLGDAVRKMAKIGRKIVKKKEPILLFF